ncbi:hypothetical protein BKA69DRAFT_1122650 [Paraphysoderma sedebokerense]|nr:hypothetical protein BKA69DRAFT_1122650 [Paraphysoderma sedebokerense]
MGNSLSSTASSVTAVEALVSEIPEVQYEKRHVTFLLSYSKRFAGSARFLKTIKAKHNEGPIVIKIFVKPEQGVSLQTYVSKLLDEKELLSDIPNVLHVQRILETEKAGYLLRQHFAGNLYDRISTRPFLADIEKKWIAFQIMSAVGSAHAMGVCHGDIKTENILVTSWNWIYLTDFASCLKPAYLPIDNPADFSFFFDTASRRSCYIAPERFFDPDNDEVSRQGEHKNQRIDGVTPEMDVFSLGCVLAELFLEGHPIFTLSQLLQYRSDTYNPNPDLMKIEDPHIRELITHMIQPDPSKRHSVAKYLSDAKNTIFPSWFYSFLHSYMNSLLDSESLHSYIEANTDSDMGRNEDSYGFCPGFSKFNAMDLRIQRIFNEFDKIAVCLGIMRVSGLNSPSLPEATSSSKSLEDGSGMPDGSVDNERVDGEATVETPDNENGHRDDEPNRKRSVEVMGGLVFDEFPDDAGYKGKGQPLLPLSSNLPNYQPPSKHSDDLRSKDAALILLSLICSCIRNLSYPTTKLHALELIYVLGNLVEDEYKLDRVIPYICCLLQDQSASVRATVLKVLTMIVSKIQSPSPSDSSIFPLYIFPLLKPILTDVEVLVRSTYAKCISSLTETAFRFLDVAMGMSGVGENGEVEWDAEGGGDLSLESPDPTQDLLNVITDHVTTLLTDPSALVKQTLLEEIPKLSVFFGKQRTGEVVLSHVITYLNDRDWRLRCAFFDSIPGLGTIVGGQSLEEYIYPLMIQSLNDSEEFVIESVLNSFTVLSELGLFKISKLRELVESVAPLLVHPNIWIRYAAVGFISSSASHLPLTDVVCILNPIIRPFLKTALWKLNELTILENLKDPVPRIVYTQCISFAAKKPNFLKTLGSKQSNEVDRSERMDVEKIIDKLRSLGMQPEDEPKLVALQNYILKSVPHYTGSMKSKNLTQMNDYMENGYVALKNLNVTPHTVFLTPVQFSMIQNPRTVATGSVAPRLNAPAGNAIARSSSDGNIGRYGNKNITANISEATATSLYNSTSTTTKSSTSSTQNKPSPITTQPRTSSRQSSRRSSIDSSSSTPMSSSAAIPQTQTLRQSTSIPNLALSKSSSLAVPSTATVITTIETSVSRRTSSSQLGGMVSSSSEMRRNSVVSGIASSSTTNPAPSDIWSTTYDGNNTYLRKLLAKRTLDAFPDPLPDLGKTVKYSAPLIRQRYSYSKNKPITSLSNWKPDGGLIAHLNEHRGPVNQIRVAPNNSFFASCSDDGTVKIWDCHRLEKNVSNRSKVTYNQQGGNIRCMTFCENSHSIASGSVNGSIHLFRVDYQGSGKYGQCLPVEEKSLEGEYPIEIEHFQTEMESLLVYATSRSRIIGWDLRTSKNAFELQNPISYGTLTAMAIDTKHNWLLVGTNRGIFTVWDIRFHIPLKSWVHPSRSRIHRITSIPHTASKSKLVLCSVGRNEVSLWDVETTECRQVFCVQEGSEGISVSYKALNPPGPDDFMQSSLRAYEETSTNRRFKGVICPLDCNYIIAGGSDRKLRFWDFSEPSKSFVVAGLENDEIQPKYKTTQQGATLIHLESGQYKSHPKPAHRNNTGFSLTEQQVLVNHLDAITDVQITEIPYPMIITSGRDGVVKVFR